jgi:pimeloyl-ACP methyl ester carboxylesterase
MYFLDIERETAMLDLALQIGWVASIVVGAIIVLLVLGMIFETLSHRAAARRFPAPGLIVEANGRKMHIFCKGAALGPTIVLEMGAAEPSPYWWAIQDAVAGFARVCSYDRAGFGWSEKAKGPTSLESRAADLHAVLKAASIPGPYVLVGHSLGGPLIRLFARDHLEETAGLVFVDTPDEAAMFRDAYQTFVRKTMKPMVRMMRLARRFGILRVVESLSPNGGLPPQFTADARHATAAVRCPAFLDTALDDFDAVTNAPAALRREHGLGGPVGDRPVSVISHSQKFPPPYDVLEFNWDEGQQTLAALSTNSELIVAEKSGHLIQIDEPEVVIEAIRRVWLAARDRKPLSIAA